MKPTFTVIIGLLGAIVSAGAAFAVIKSYNPFAMHTDFVVVASDVYSGEVNDQNKFILDASAVNFTLSNFVTILCLSAIPQMERR